MAYHSRAGPGLRFMASQPKIDLPIVVKLIKYIFQVGRQLHSQSPCLVVVGFVATFIAAIRVYGPESVGPHTRRIWDRLATSFGPRLGCVTNLS